MKFKVSFLVLLLHFTVATAQDTVPVRLNRQYITSYFKDAGDIIISPLKWNKKQWLQAGGTVAITGALITQDLNIYRFFQRNRSTLTDNLSKYALEPWGDGMYSLGVTGSFYLYGMLASHHRAKKVGFIAVKTVLVTAIVNYAFKNLFHRHRPYQLEEQVKSGAINAVTQYGWDGPIAKPSFNSFPSGHTMSAFAMATIFATEYKEYKWVPIVSYSLAGLTGLSRINDNRHWGSDVFFGAVIGWGMAKLIYNHNNWGINMAPYSTGSETGMLIQIPLN